MPFSEGDHVTLSVQHKTTFNYSAPVSDPRIELHISPVDTGVQKVLSHNITLTPDAQINHRRDQFGNCVACFDLPQAHDRLEIIATSMVETTNAVSCGPESEPDSRPYQERWHQFLQGSPGVPELPDYGTIKIERELSMDMDDIEFGHGLYMLARHFFEHFQYNPDISSPHASPKTVFEGGIGSSHDMTHAMIGVLRQAGIPSRYVSGYVFNPGKGQIGEQVRGSSGTHAWVQAWHEEYGWMGVDPSNSKLVDWQYVRTAIGRDYFDVPPHHLTFSGAASQSVEETVQIDLVKVGD